MYFRDTEMTEDSQRQADVERGTTVESQGV